MKTSLFHPSEKPTELAGHLMGAAGLHDTLKNIIANCIRHNLSLRDASTIVHQEVALVFAKAVKLAAQEHDDEVILEVCMDITHELYHDGPALIIEKSVDNDTNTSLI